MAWINGPVDEHDIAFYVQIQFNGGAKSLDDLADGKMKINCVPVSRDEISYALSSLEKRGVLRPIADGRYELMEKQR